MILAPTSGSSERVSQTAGSACRFPAGTLEMTSALVETSHALAPRRAIAAGSWA